jgi:hypothetical protein
VFRNLVNRSQVLLPYRGVPVIDIGTTCVASLDGMNALSDRLWVPTMPFRANMCRAAMR